MPEKNSLYRSEQKRDFEMKMKTEGSKEAYLYRVLYIMTGVVALFPVSCNYIMSGGIVTEWIARIEELRMGLQAWKPYLFPSAETFINTGIRVNGMNSNFWFIIPAVLYLLTGKIVLTYRVYMLVVQTATLCGAILFFQKVFGAEKTKLPAFFATLLYMTCPYRIYVCYDFANLSQATAWMLLPFYAWAIAGLVMGEKRRKFGKKDAFNLFLAGLLLAGIGYADVIFFLIAMGITALIAVVLRRLRPLVSLAVGSACFLPGLYRLAQYLFTGAYAELEMPLKSIMGDGYRFGQYFGSYAFRDGHPGMGMGMLLCLLTGLWLKFVKGRGEERKTGTFFAVLSFVLIFFSFRHFPWDYVQRMGVWALKLVSLIDTPAVFWGVGFLFLCVPAGYAMNGIRKHEDTVAAFVIPVMVILFCIGICVYQCNTLTYNRFPLITP